MRPASAGSDSDQARAPRRQGARARRGRRPSGRERGRRTSRLRRASPKSPEQREGGQGKARRRRERVRGRRAPSDARSARGKGGTWERPPSPQRPGGALACALATSTAKPWERICRRLVSDRAGAARGAHEARASASFRYKSEMKKRNQGFTPWFFCATM